MSNHVPDDHPSDDEIREGIVSLMDEALDPRPFPAGRLGVVEPDRVVLGRSGRFAGLPRNLVVAAAVLVAVVAGIGVWALDDEPKIQVVDEKPQSKNAFQGWTPGWHTIEPGPVPAMNGAALAWTGEALVVAGTSFPEEGVARSSAFSYDPQARAWTELPDPPFDNLRIVAAGGRLVAVGYDDRYPAPPDYQWATLDPGKNEWTVRGAAPTAPQLAGIGGALRRDQLVWTGERVIDVGLGGVLDPVSGVATALPMPDDIVAFDHLVGSTPVWTSDQVVLAAWGPNPGLAWNELGTEWAETPGQSAAVPVDPLDGPAPAVASDGRVVLIATRDGQPGPASSLDSGAREWTTLPDVPETASHECPYRAAAVGDEVVVQPCPDGYGPLVRLDGERWVEIGSVPYAEECCMGSWLGTPNALVTWSTDIDTLNNPRAPYREGAVWIPADNSEMTD